MITDKDKSKVNLPGEQILKFTKETASLVKVYQKPTGPIIIEADLISVEDNRQSTQQHKAKVSLCGCGKSASAPYCDGSHKH